MKFKNDLFPVASQVGYQAGIQAELMFPGIGFGIDFGLLYNQMGAKLDLGSRHLWQSQGFGNDNFYLHTIQIPIHLRFKWTRMNGLEDYIAPFVYGGPEMAILAGHSGPKGNPGVEDPFQYSGGDFGIGAGGGVELLKRWQISFQYTWGMSYLMKARQLDNYSAKNGQWAIRVAYMF